MTSLSRVSADVPFLSMKLYPSLVNSTALVFFLQDWSRWQVWPKGGGYQLLNARWWAHVKGHRNILQYSNWGDAYECSGLDL